MTIISSATFVRGIDLPNERMIYPKKKRSLRRSRIGPVLAWTNTDGTRTCLAEDLWSAARDYGRAHGLHTEEGIVHGCPPL